MNKNIITIIVIIAIIGSILYLESTKPDRVDTQGKEISLAEIGDNAANNTAIGITQQARQARIATKEKQYSKAVELVSPDGYINTVPFNLSDVVGKKVILVDFWTYSCINCQRTLPYLVNWNKKYSDKGLLIVGVHTPEFDFEKDYANVKRAVDKYRIKYPVVQDNEYQTWTAYQNHYWPRKYLIDIDGFIVYDHIGEGGYDESEEKIQELLQERANTLGLDAIQKQQIGGVQAITVDTSQVLTPEIYFGVDFSRDQFGNEQGWKLGKTVVYTAPQTLEKNMFYLEGSFLNNPDNMEVADTAGKVLLKYRAKNVYVVAGAEQNTTVTVLVDGKQVGTLVVGPQDLYPVVQDSAYGEHILELRASKGVRFYTFTFG